MIVQIGSLFSGIGGLELGLEWAGVGRTVWQVERDPFCRSILARHWPDAIRFDDVRTVGAHNLEPVDVICGGFPCQDISYAGKGLGLSGERSGLWFEFARIVGEMGPSFVVVENVTALRSRGLDQVLGALASFGYDAQWRSIRASDAGAAHRRERLFIVAYSASFRSVLHNKKNPRTTRNNRRRLFKSVRTSGQDAQQRQTESSMGRVSNGIPGYVDRWPARPDKEQEAWEAPRTCETVANRAERLRALGNAVVPHVAKVVGQWLLDINAERQINVIDL